MLDLGATGAALARLDVHLSLPGNWSRAATICRAIEASAAAGLAGHGAAPEMILHLRAGLHHPAARAGVWLGLDTFRVLETLERLAFDGDGLPTLDAIAEMSLRACASSDAYAGAAPSGRPPEMLERYLRSGDPADWPSAAGPERAEAIDRTDDWIRALRPLVEAGGHALPVLAEAVRTFLAMRTFGEDTVRMAGLMVPALLYRWGWTRFAPAVFVSQSLARVALGRRSAAVERPEDWAPLFLAVLRSAARTQEDRIVRIANRAKLVHMRIAGRRATSAMPAAVDWVFAHPVFSLALMASGVDRSEPGARMLVDGLVEAGLVDRPPRGSYRAFTAGSLFDGGQVRPVD